MTNSIATRTRREFLWMVTGFLLALGIRPPEVTATPEVAAGTFVPMPLKIFQIDYNECWMASSLPEAIAAARAWHGELGMNLTADELREQYANAYEIPDTALDIRIRICDPDDEELDQTFRQALKEEIAQDPLTPRMFSAGDW